MIPTALLALALAGTVPDNLTDICMWDDATTTCIDAPFFTERIMECGNPRPLDAYDGGAGMMFLDVADPYPDYVLRYGWRSYNVRYFGTGRDALLVFAYQTGDGPLAWDGGFADGMEHCEVWTRQ